MANRAVITIRVYAATGGSKLQYTTGGRWRSFTAAGYNRQVLQLPYQPTDSLQRFWNNVLAEVTADITANP